MKDRKCIPEFRVEPEEPGAYEARKTLDQVIACCFSGLRSFHEGAWPNDPFENCLREVSDALDNQSINSITMGREWVAYLGHQLPDTFGVPFTHALIFSILAERASNKGEIHKAWPLICKASALLGLADGAYRPSEPNAPEQRRQIAKKGGIAKSEKHGQRVRKEAARLLAERRPETGWFSVAAAVSAVERDLTSFVDANGLDMATSNLGAKLRRWIKDDDLVLHAYQGKKSPESD